MKPCPFCGAEDANVDSDIESVVCHACGATGPSVLKKEFETDEEMMFEAEKAWNERVTQCGVEIAPGCNALCTLSSGHEGPHRAVSTRDHYP